MRSKRKRIEDGARKFADSAYRTFVTENPFLETLREIDEHESPVSRLFASVNPFGDLPSGHRVNQADAEEYKRLVKEYGAARALAVYEKRREMEMNFPDRVVVPYPEDEAEKAWNDLVKRHGVTESLRIWQEDEPGPPPPADSAKCPYCGDGLRQPVVCPHCETPHCAECWNERPGCCVYGCNDGRSPVKKQTVPGKENEKETKYAVLYPGMLPEPIDRSAYRSIIDQDRGCSGSNETMNRKRLTRILLEAGLFGSFVWGVLWVIREFAL